MLSLIGMLCLSFVEPAEFDVSRLPQTLQARDSLMIGDEQQADARECLKGLSWDPMSFNVDCTRATERCDIYVKFPSPKSTGDKLNDVVVIEGSLAKDKQGRVIRAAAVVVVHESGSSMPVGRLVASGLRDRGMHAFMVQLPHYGQRRGSKRAPKADLFASGMKQAIADVRRARDAVAVLPCVEANKIGLQGTSLGGFVTANVGALDQGFDRVFILLAGGDLPSMLKNGRREVAQMRRELANAGFTEDAVSQMLRVVEPTRTAHRLRPEHTWLYSAILDQVVPLDNGFALAKSASLSKDHHIRLLADHYTGIIYLPLVLDHIKRNMN